MPAPAGVIVDVPAHDWIIDLVVLWRWPGEAPELTQSAVGSELGRSADVHRIIAGDRELRVVFDPRAGTVQIENGAVLPLNGANVLMLAVGERDVTVAGLATVDGRIPSDSSQDPMAPVIARSPEVAAFVGRTQ